VQLQPAADLMRDRQNGGVLDEVEVPARKVTACTFGGTRLDELFITTSREDLEPGEDPLAGSLFRVAAGTRGQSAANSRVTPGRAH
jgi:sugar lactone lactonase YvrE